MRVLTFCLPDDSITINGASRDFGRQTRVASYSAPLKLYA